MVNDAYPGLRKLRRELHRFPEPSGAEAATAGRISNFIDACRPDLLIRGLGGHGLAAVFDFGQGGPTVLIRAELDALPIEEVNSFDHRSRHSGFSHKCGHDGHMTIVAGLAVYLSERPFTKGRVVLLFQPAEETGEGAKAILEDEKFGGLAPDHVFALHNIPGMPLHQVIVVAHQFSATVQSVAIRLTGRESHAAEPENGRNPAWAMAEITQAIRAWQVPDPAGRDFLLITPVHAVMGKKEYGISAGYGELHFTMRCWSTAAMDDLVARLEQLVQMISRRYGLLPGISYFDYFPATINDQTANGIVAVAAQQASLDVQHKKVPYKFGEDFGWFTQKYPGAMFGLGAGEHTPVLHNNEYDFPDELIGSGIAVFQGIIRKILAP